MKLNKKKACIFILWYFALIGLVLTTSPFHITSKIGFFISLLCIEGMFFVALDIIKIGKVERQKEETP